MTERLTSTLLSGLLAVSLAGCTGPSPQAPATAEELNTLKSNMNETFGALEMYSADNQLQYPSSLDQLKPKYLDEIPRDPVARQALSYQKTEEGFLLGSKGDYKALGAEKGFPKMNQDGFFVKKAEEFPSEE